MNEEKAIANNHALTAYAHEMLPQFGNVMKAINDYVFNPNEDTAKALRMNAPAIRSLYRLVDDYSKALADLKEKMNVCVLENIESAPEIAHEFKVQNGTKSIKCDSAPNSMQLLMSRYLEAGYDPVGLFAKCSAITAKKAAEAFGLSEQALLEAHGDLFETHYNKPSVKML